MNNSRRVEYIGNIPKEEYETVMEQVTCFHVPYLIHIWSSTADLHDLDAAHKLNSEMASLIEAGSDVTVSMDGDVRIVRVGELPCPCGGTHVKNVADLKVRGSELT